MVVVVVVTDERCILETRTLQLLMGQRKSWCNQVVERWLAILPSDFERWLHLNSLSGSLVGNLQQNLLVAGVGLLMITAGTDLAFASIGTSLQARA